MASKKTFIWAIGPRINADVIALDRKPNGAQNFVNQLMTNAKLVKTTDEHRIFADEKGKYVLTAELKRNEVIRILKSAKATQAVNAYVEVAEFYGQYTASNHAMERFKERFPERVGNKSKSQVSTHINDVLKVATFHSTMSSVRGVVYYYDALKHGMRLVLDKQAQTVLTVYQLASVQPTLTSDSPLFDVFVKTAKRELRKATERFRKQQRIMTAELSAIQIEIAKSAVNRTRAKGEHIIERIDAKVTKMQRKADEISRNIAEIESEHGRIATEVRRLVGGAE